MRTEGIRSLAALMETALSRYLAAASDVLAGDGSVGTSSDPRLVAAVEELTTELKKAIPVLVAVALGFRELQDQFDDITVAIGRWRGAALALEEIQAKGRG